MSQVIWLVQERGLRAGTFQAEKAKAQKRRKLGMLRCKQGVQAGWERWCQRGSIRRFCPRFRRREEEPRDTGHRPAGGCGVEERRARGSWGAVLLGLAWVWRRGRH